jgi:hypothetical protein
VGGLLWGRLLVQVVLCAWVALLLWTAWKERA